jgi:hypothetical protein
VEYNNVGKIVPFIGYVNADYAGIRPSCYIDMSKTAIASGSGTKEDPYRFSAESINNNANIINTPTVRTAIGFGPNPSQYVYVKFTESSGFPFIDDANRVQVPLRKTLEKFGGKVEWDAVNKIATITENNIKVQVPIGEKYILRDGQKIEIDTAAMIVNGRTYLPIRPVVEAFDGKVRWDSVEKVVIITNT